MPGAEVCAYDVDWFWWWWSKQQVGCATTDINGSFDISFRWCCGFWPWWWWENRFWEFRPEIAEAIVPVLEQDPRVQLGAATNMPSLALFQPLLAKAGIDTTTPLAELPANKLDGVRDVLLEKLPASPELERLRIWPWWRWEPWWDCTPDIIFEATQDCLFPGAVIVNEGYSNTRWDIPDPLNVVLTANSLACCKPKDPCVEGDCIEISAFCSEEGIALDDVGGNLGADPLLPLGYGPGDRAFSETVTVYKANTFVGVDYYEIEYAAWNPVTMTWGSWGPLPAVALEDFCRHWLRPVFPFQKADVPFQWKTRLDGAVKHLVVESREHYETANPLPFPAYWEISSQLVVALNTIPAFPDGTYKFHVVGWQDNGVDKIKNGHVLDICGTKDPAEFVLTFDNRVYPNPMVTHCGTGFIHVCTTEPTTAINAVTINGSAIPACGVTEILGDLEIDFEAYDPDGHLAGYSLYLEWGASNSIPLIGVGGSSLTVDVADYVGPDYATALLQGATRPTWHGGTYKYKVLAATVFTEPCCYLIRLQANKRHDLGYGIGNCGFGCENDVYYNIDEFTVGAGVCDPPRREIALPAAATAVEAEVVS